MGGTTEKLALPYPDMADSPNVPRDIKALADKVEEKLGTVSVNDTGWRQCNGTNMLYGWTATGMYLRRSGNVCMLQVDALKALASTSTQFFSIPTGFGSTGGDVEIRGLLYTNASPPVIRSVSGNVHVQRVISDTLYGVLTWMTTQAWPTTLPGSAA